MRVELAIYAVPERYSRYSAIGSIPGPLASGQAGAKLKNRPYRPNPAALASSELIKALQRTTSTFIGLAGRRGYECASKRASSKQTSTTTARPDLLGCGGEDLA